MTPPFTPTHPLLTDSPVSFSLASWQPTPSPLALLAATCSKIGSPSPEEESAINAAVKVYAAGQNHQIVATASNAAHNYVPLASQQTLGVLNPDGTVTPVTSVGHPAPGQAPGGGNNQSSAGQTLKTISVPTSGAQAVNGQVYATQTPGGNLTYNVIPQIQNIQIDGQETSALFIPSSFSGQQTIQFGGNQTIFAGPNGQTYIRATAAPQQPNNNSAQASVQANGQTGTVMQNVGLGNNLTFAQIGGQNVAIRQGNVLQALQLPMGATAVQQTIPVQVPISTSNGQTIFQTIHLPVQTMQTMSGQMTAQVVSPQMQGQVAQVNTRAFFYVILK